METITNEQITALRNEAANAGDLETVRECDAALLGDDDARERCAEIIRDARAMED